MIRHRAMGLHATFGLRRRLIVGLAVLTALTVVVNLGTIGTLMRDRMYRGTDVRLRHQASVLQSILESEERAIADDGTMAASLQGMGEVLAARNAAQLKRLLIPVMISHELTSIYVIYPDRSAVLLMGEPMTDRDRLSSSRLVERGFDFLSSSGMLEFDGTLWLGAVAAHRRADGAPDGLILLGKRLDSAYLQSMSELVGLSLALGWGNGVAYSFDPIPSDLSSTQMRSYRTELAEYRDGAYSFRNMNIGDVSYRLLAFDFTSRNGRPLVGYLFQPTLELDEAMRMAIVQVVGVGLVMTVLGVAFSFFYVRTLTRPLALLEQAAQSIAQGDLGTPLRVESRDGVGHLAQVFDSMRVHLDEMMKKQERWNAELEAQVQAKTEEMRRLCESRDKLLRQMMTTQEEERRRIARELHDETSQALTTLKVHLATTEMGLSGEVKAEIAEARRKTAEILREVNRIVLDLRPTVLDDFGLEAALSWYATSRLENTETKVEMVNSGMEARLSPAVETVLFRIGQEAISNAAKYAKAKNLKVSLVFEPKSDLPVVTLHIEDDGCGFDAQGSRTDWDRGRPHLGLLGMQERVELVGGEVEIHSTPGQGTHVIARVPLSVAVQEQST